MHLLYLSFTTINQEHLRRFEQTIEEQPLGVTDSVADDGEADIVQQEEGNNNVTEDIHNSASYIQWAATKVNRK